MVNCSAAIQSMWTGHKWPLFCRSWPGYVFSNPPPPPSLISVLSPILSFSWRVLAYLPSLCNISPQISSILGRVTHVCLVHSSESSNSPQKPISQTAGAPRCNTEGMSDLCRANRHSVTAAATSAGKAASVHRTNPRDIVKTCHWWVHSFSPD